MSQELSRIFRANLGIKLGPVCSVKQDVQAKKAVRNSNSWPTVKLIKHRSGAHTSCPTFQHFLLLKFGRSGTLATSWLSVYVVGRSSKFGFRSRSTAQCALVLKLCSYKQLQPGVINGSGRRFGFHVSCYQTSAPRFATLTLGIRRSRNSICLWNLCYLSGWTADIVEDRNEFSLYRTTD